MVAYKGAMRADPAITRSKEEAKQRAESLLARVKKGEDFAKVAKEGSDDKGSAANGGSLGTFGRGQMVKPFEEAVFALPPGGVSGLVESPFGFHVIKRAAATP